VASYRRGGVSVGAYRVEDNRGVGSGCGIARCGDVGVPVDPDGDRRDDRLGETYSESACGVDDDPGVGYCCEIGLTMLIGGGEAVAWSWCHVGPVQAEGPRAGEGRGVEPVLSEGVGEGVSQPAALEAICCGMVDASWPEGLDQHGSAGDGGGPVDRETGVNVLTTQVWCSWSCPVKKQRTSMAQEGAGERLKDDILCGCWHKK